MRRAYVLENGEVAGPYDERELLERFEAGELLADDQVCDEGEEKWTALGDWLASNDLELIPPRLDPPVLPQNWSITGTEESYFESQGIAVTKTRLIVGPPTYAMSGITSVREQANAPKTGGGIALTLFGCFPLLPAVGLLMEPRTGDGRGWWGIMAILLLFSTGLIFCGVQIVRNARPSYSVFVRTSGGEIAVWHSSNSAVIRGLTAAVNRAIVERG